MSKSLIGILTFRRLNALKAMLEGVEQHCGQYACVVSEDCGQRDNTEFFLKQGRVAESRPELLATAYTTDFDGAVTANFPNTKVLLGDRNLGVSGNSNRIIKTFMDGDWDHLCLCNDDLFVTGDFVKFYAQAHKDLGVGLY